jgi:hypothetical protein
VNRQVMVKERARSPPEARSPPKSAPPPLLEVEQADQVEQRRLDARVDGSSVLLTSERRQRFVPGSLRLILMTPAGVSSGLLLSLIAVPQFGDEPDADADGVADSLDNCASVSNTDQNTDRAGAASGR